MYTANRTAIFTASEVESMLQNWKKSAGFYSKADIVCGLSEACLGWPYVFGAAGEMCTVANRKKYAGYNPGYADNIRKACPVLSGKQPACDGCQWVDTRIFDCRGFTRWLLEQVEIPLFGGGATTQWETASNWVAKGGIESIPRGLVCCVFKRKEGRMSHTGMHVGGGEIIHCSTTVKTDTLPGRPAWTHWAIPAGLYTTEELRKAGITVQNDDNIPTLRRGSQGDEVADLQMLLNSKFGYKLDIDGDFGKATETAVKDFQTKHGLTVDGVVGKKTWAALGVKDINVPGNVNPPADNGNNEIPPSDLEQPQTITIPLTDWQSIKAAISAAYHIIKQYEG